MQKNMAVLEVDEIRVASWSPDPEAVEPPEQVHLLIRVRGIVDPFVVRFRSPVALDELVAALQSHRDEVWQ